MKIAQIVCAYPPYSGGIGNSAKRLSDLLLPEIEMETFHPDNSKPWLRLGHGAFMPGLLNKLGRFDFIYLHYPFFGTAEIVWLFKIFKRRTKLVIHYHMDVTARSWATEALSWPSKLIRRQLFKMADTIVCASLDYIKNSQIKKYYSLWPEKFLEIPFGLNLDLYHPKILKNPGDSQMLAKAKAIVEFVNERFIKRDCLNLIFVGALDRAHYFKGVDVMLRALSQLEHKSWKLAIVGYGDLKESYERTAADLGLKDRIRFLGKLTDQELVRAYQNADALLLPSTNGNEAFGLVLIEAMACGLPVIASDLPGVRSVFNNGLEGYLIKPGDAEDLRAKIDYLSRQETERRAMARRARELAEKKYDQKKIKARYLSLFQK